MIRFWKKRSRRRKPGIFTLLAARVDYALWQPLAKWRRRRRKARGRQGPLAKALVPLGWLGRTLALPLWLSARLAASAWSGIRRGWRARNVRHLVQGLPALLGAVGVLVLAAAVHRQEPALGLSYQSAAQSATQRGDHQAARVYRERLSQINDSNWQNRFDLALTLHQLDETERAEAIIGRLAPADASGYAPAHHWRARQLLRSGETYRSPERVREAHAHLVRAEKGLPHSPQVQLTLAQYYLAMEQRETAARHLARAAAAMPDLNFDLANLYAALGKEALARRAMERVQEYYKPLVRQNPENVEARLRWASACMNLDNFRQTVEILEQGRLLHPDGPFHSALAEACIGQYDKRLRDRRTDPAVLLALLRKSLQYQDDFGPALLRLVQFANGPNGQTEAARQLLQTMLVQGRIPSVAHLALGVNAWQQDDANKAQWHLERAYKLDESLGPVANNLAWVLAHNEPPELQRALEIIDSVLQRWPDNPYYRDTRGQILAKLERWPEALDDLERALIGLPDNPQLHETLALVYRQLGMPEMAEPHERVVSELATPEK